MTSLKRRKEMERLNKAMYQKILNLTVIKILMANIVLNKPSIGNNQKIRFKK